MNDLLTDVRTRYEQELQSKTCWGKDEVLRLLDRVIIQVQSEYLARLVQTPKTIPHDGRGPG